MALGFPRLAPSPVPSPHFFPRASQGPHLPHPHPQLHPKVGEPGLYLAYDQMGGRSWGNHDSKSYHRKPFVSQNSSKGIFWVSHSLYQGGTLLSLPSCPPWPFGLACPPFLRWWFPSPPCSRITRAEIPRTLSQTLSLVHSYTQEV